MQLDKIDNLSIYTDTNTGKQGLQHLELAKLANVARETLSRWLSGKTITDFSHVEILKPANPKIVELHGCLDILTYRKLDSAYAPDAIRTITKLLNKSIVKTNGDFLMYCQNGVEFYTHKTTGVSGMSIRGLARACDVSEAAIHKWLTRYELGRVGFNQNESETSESLTEDGLEGVNMWLNGKVNNNAKIVLDSVCTKALLYYAFKSRTPSLKAEKTYGLMANIGTRTFIQGMTKWSDGQRSAKKLVKSKEKNWSDWSTKLLGGSTPQVKLESGKVIDLIWDDMLIEIKNAKSWSYAIGQLISYQMDYAKEKGLSECSIPLGLILFGDLPTGDTQEKVLSLCRRVGIRKVIFVPSDEE